MRDSKNSQLNKSLSQPLSKAWMNYWSLLLRNHMGTRGTSWRISWVDSFQSEGCGFDSRSSRHVGTLFKSLTRSCLLRFGVKLRHTIRAVSGALLSRCGLEEAL